MNRPGLQRIPFYFIMMGRGRVAGLAVGAVLLACVMEVDGAWGKKKEDEGDMKWVKLKGVKCLDGSNAGYYIRPSAKKETKDWVIALGEGQWCTTEKECIDRVAQTKGKTPPSTAHDIGGAISGDSYENPDLAGWNHVLVPSCDYTSFLGNRGDKAVSLSTIPGWSKAHFQGHDILTGAIRDLVSNRGLSSLGRVLLAGSGTGGFAVLSNIDHVASLLRSLTGDAAKDVVGIIDAAFIPLHVTTPAAAILLEKAHSLWNAVVPRGGCGGRKGGGCLSSMHVSENVTSPLYVIQSTHDPVHMDFSHAIGACPGGMMATGGCASTGAKTDEWHEAVVESVKHVRTHGSHGLYVIGCATHERTVSRGCIQGGECVNWRDHYVQVGCQRISAQEAFGDWYISRPWTSKAPVEFRQVVDKSRGASNPSCRGGSGEEGSCAGEEDLGEGAAAYEA